MNDECERRAGHDSSSESIPRYPLPLHPETNDLDQTDTVKDIKQQLEGATHWDDIIRVGALVLKELKNQLKKATVDDNCVDYNETI